uniref:Suspensor-specific protein n=1 Tax=Phaseolus coccineus TaxID=3886 RepID=Q9FUP7_PHACN|nr:suspensor-specific protein [Phaseolus coccineus]
MSPFCRNFSMAWVLMAFVLFANSAMPTNGSTVGVKNMLGGKLMLSVLCFHIDKEHIIPNGGSFEWTYNGGAPPIGHSPFMCFFRWNNVHHSLDLCRTTRHAGCESAIWEIKEKQYCRYIGKAEPANYVCDDWID